MRTANPALSDRYFEAEAAAAPRSNVMTVNGAAVKTGVLAAVLLAAGGLSWSLVFPGGVGPDAPPANGQYALLFVLGGLFAGLVTSLVMCFSPRTSPVLAPIYAAAEGLFLGAVSGMFAGKYQGIVLEAALLTVGILLVMLLAYTSGLIRATEKFKLGVVAATGGICLVYLASMLFRVFGVNVPYLHDAVYGNAMLGIGFSVFVCVIAALNLVLDFDVIETGARYGAPKYMEWFAAFGLLVTLVWLYLEILRLLAKLRSSNN